MRFAIFLSLLLAISSPSLSFAKSQDDFSVIAKVNGEVITKFDLENRTHFLITTSNIKSDPEFKEQFSRKVLQDMIDESLQRQEALNKGVEVSDELVMSEIKNIISNQNMSLAGMKSYFKKNRLSFDDYYKQIEAQILWARFVAEKIKPQVKAKESEMSEALKQKVHNIKKEKFLVYEIFLPFNPKAKNKNQDMQETASLAYKIVAALRQRRANFATIARQLSKSPSSKRDGKVGWIGEGDIIAPIFAQISNLKDGQISEPLAIEQGFYIFKVTARKEEKLTKEELYLNYRQNLLSNKLDGLIKNHMAKLRSEAFIEQY